MAVFDEHEPHDHEPSSRRTALIAGAGLSALLLAVGGYWMTRPGPEPAVPETAPAATSAPATRPEISTPTPEAPPSPATREPRARTRTAPEPTPTAPAAPEPTAPVRELVVETDVEGALVFLDRKFLGNAPVTTTDVAPGTHQINVSAEGHDGVARTVDVAEAGPTRVTIRLKEVRLSEAVEVIHKHSMGSCQGRLTADLSGFRYAPTKGDDGFSVPLDAVETFEIDYLKKNLRLKRKGGMTWNFESPTGSPDPLFVFHRDVEKARAKLAAQR
jgi:hypothetical protein